MTTFSTKKKPLDGWYRQISIKHNFSINKASCLSELLIDEDKSCMFCMFLLLVLQSVRNAT